jgi:hypothetical protein
LSLYVLFGFGWLFWLGGIIALLHVSLAMGAIGGLLAVWKLKFWFWVWPSLFKWILKVPPYQEWPL